MPLGGQKSIALKTVPQKPPLYKTFDRITGPHKLVFMKPLLPDPEEIRNPHKVMINYNLNHQSPHGCLQG